MCRPWPSASPVCPPRRRRQARISTWQRAGVTRGTQSDGAPDSPPQRSVGPACHASGGKYSRTLAVHRAAYGLVDHIVTWAGLAGCNERVPHEVYYGSILDQDLRQCRAAAVRRVGGETGTRRWCNTRPREPTSLVAVAVEVAGQAACRRGRRCRDKMRAVDARAEPIVGAGRLRPDPNPPPSPPSDPRPRRTRCCSGATSPRRSIPERPRAWWRRCSRRDWHRRRRRSKPSAAASSAVAVEVARGVQLV